MLIKDEKKTVSAQDFEDRSKMDGDRESYWTTYSYNSKDLSLYALGGEYPLTTQKKTGFLLVLPAINQPSASVRVELSHREFCVVLTTPCPRHLQFIKYLQPYAIWYSVLVGTASFFLFSLSWQYTMVKHTNLKLGIV